MRPAAPAAPAALAALAVLFLVAGCSGGAVGHAGDAAPASPTTSRSSSPTGTGPSSSPAAAGVRLTRPHSSVVAPEGWTRGRQVSRDADSADSPDQLSYVELSEIEAFGSTADAAELGRTRIRSSIDARPPKLLPVTELDGVPVYHVAGFVNAEQYLEEYGAVREDRIVMLTLSFNRRVPAAERDRVVAAVLPTFEWR